MDRFFASSSSAAQAETRVSSSSSVAQPARVKPARSDAGASTEQALAIPPPDGENGVGGVGSGTSNVYLDSPSQVVGWWREW